MKNDINEDELFVNRRFLKNIKGIPLYYNNNGVLKRILSRYLSKVDESQVWIKFTDLSEDQKEALKEVAIPFAQIPKVQNSDTKLYDKDGVRIHVNDETLLVPVVGNILFGDGTYAYTVVRENDKLTLKTILVCWDCHWSDLFLGRSKFKNNVFCLVSDLGEEKIKEFIDEIIPLKDVPEYLKQNSIELETNEKSL